MQMTVLKFTLQIYTITYKIYMDIRKELSKRLDAEAKRKGFDSSKIASLANLPSEIVNDYFEGKKEIKFEELRPICDTLNVGLMWLLSADYQPSHLLFRALPNQDLTKVSQIENAFLIVNDILPPIKKNAIPVLNIEEKDQAMLQSTIDKIVLTLRNQYSTVEKLYLAFGIGILPVSAGDNGFDAFIMNFGKVSIVCINRNKPPARIHFSLLHEIAHYFWHKNQDIPVDNFDDIYLNPQKNISDKNMPEFIANKFAQQFIFPMKEIEFIAPKWERESSETIYKWIVENRTSPEVLSFAIFDNLKFRPNKIPLITTIIEGIKNKAGIGLGKDRTVIDFIEKQGVELKQSIYKNKEKFSDNVWAKISTTWELES